MQGNLSQIDLDYRYDKVGRLTEVNDQGKQFIYQYDQAGKLIKELNGVTGVKTDYRYYPSGNIRNLRHSLANDTVSFYEYKYDKRGNQVQKDEGVGTTKYYYDSLSRVKIVLNPDNSILNYEYDDLNNIKEMAEIKGSKISQTLYTYDNDSRLLLQETDNGSETIQQRFTYDAGGNQLTKEEVIKRNGALVSSKDYRFWWNGFNQVERVQDPEGKFIDYKYNGLGLRTKKEFGDTSTNYFYDQGNIILEADQNMMVTAKSIRGKRLIYRETDNDILYYLHNAHGDVTQLLDEYGQVMKDYRYDPFGNEDNYYPLPAFGGNVSKVLWQQEVEQIDNPFQYCGEYLDEETGNYYLRARYYDPGIERFISEDNYEGEIINPLSFNLYTYCSNNPIIYIDPTGHWQEGDGKISKSAQNEIRYLTNRYSNATSKASRDWIKKQGDKIRSEDGNSSSKSNGKGNMLIAAGVDLASYASSIERPVSLPGTISNNKVGFLPKTSITTAPYKPYSTLGKGSAVIGALTLNYDIQKTLADDHLSGGKKFAKVVIVSGGAGVSALAGLCGGTAGSIIGGRKGIATGGAIVTTSSVLINKVQNTLYKWFGLD